jgi:hypothetical protein
MTTSQDIHSGFRGPETESDRHRWGGRPRHLLYAPLIWTAHFGFVYGAGALSCAGRGADLDTTRVLVAVATLVALALLAAACMPAIRIRRRLGAESATPARRERRFLAGATLSTCLVAALAVVFNALPSIFAASCA